MGNMCTVEDVKTRLGLSDTDYDDIITQIVGGVDSIFDQRTYRTLIAPVAAVTEYYSGLGYYLQLNRYPVISIASITESYDYDFDNSTPLTVNQDYRQMNSGKNGILYKRLGGWLDAPDCIQVEYRGGFCAAGVAPGAGEHALPDDLREAAIQQTSLIFKRRDDIGLTSHGFDGGSVDILQSISLLAEVKETLKHYRRPSL